MTDARLKPADFRRRAFALMRECWKLLLIAIILMSIFDWAGQILEYYGDGVAQKVYDAHMEAFYAESPCPEDEKEAFMWAYFDEWFAQRDAEKAYNKAFLPWKIGGYAFDLLNYIFTAMILVGLYTGLLMQHRSGECSLHCLRFGFSRWRTAAWLSIRVSVNILGWGLLACIPGLMLTNHLGSVGEILALIILLLVVLWAQCHYALTYVHMAEDPENHLTTTAYIDSAVADMNFFTVRGLLRTAWPAYALMAAQVILDISTAFLPVLTIPVTIFILVGNLLTQMLLHTCYVCIYEELRTRRQAQEASDAACAHVLTANEDYIEDKLT